MWPVEVGMYSYSSHYVRALVFAVILIKNINLRRESRATAGWSVSV
jgi:hypothetical protein